MAKLTKRQKAISAKVQANKLYSFEEAAALLAEVSNVKFTESFDVAVNLGVDPRKSDQVVRGATLLPHGTGKTVRVAVFTQGANAEAALAAGADKVGMDDLAAEMKAGDLNYDVVIASPDAMRVVGQLGQLLGPRGLMPNPKVGTVSADVGTAVKNAKAENHQRHRAVQNRLGREMMITVNASGDNHGNNNPLGDVEAVIVQLSLGTHESSNPVLVAR